MSRWGKNDPRGAMCKQTSKQLFPMAKAFLRFVLVQPNARSETTSPLYGRYGASAPNPRHYRHARTWRGRVRKKQARPLTEILSQPHDGYTAGQSCINSCTIHTQNQPQSCAATSRPSPLTVPLEIVTTVSLPRFYAKPHM